MKPKLKIKIHKEEEREPKSLVKLEWEVEPKEEQWLSAKCHTWTTLCKRYRIYRIVPDGGGPIRYGCCVRRSKGWWAVENDSKLGSGYPKYYMNLAYALSVAGKHLNVEEDVESNISEVLTGAEKLGLVENACSVDRATDHKKRGRPANKPVEARLTHANALETHTAQQQHRAKTVISCDKPVKQPKGRPRSNKDQWGATVGGNESKAMSVLTDEPKNMKEIVRDGGLTQNVYNFLNKMVKAGHVKKTTDGFSMKRI